MTQFKGRTEGAESVILGAEFWSEGKKVAGRVAWEFETRNGPAYVIEAIRPVEVNGKAQRLVAVGNLTGFRMALQAAGLTRLLPGDSVVIICTGREATDKGSPRVNFEIEVDGPDR